MRRGQLVLFAAGLLGFGAAACRTPTPTVMVDGYALNADHWTSVKEDLSRRASFELNCPLTDLEFTVLKDGQGVPGVFDDWPSQVGVRGCDRQVLYLLVVDRTGWTWVTQSTAQVK